MFTPRFKSYKLLFDAKIPVLRVILRAATVRKLNALNHLRLQIGSASDATMPSTRKRRSNAAEVDEHIDSTPNSSSVLNFNQSISWSGAKSIPVAQLLTRLENLSEQLRNTAQIDDEESKESIRPVARDLVSPNLLQHKDKGVRISTIACIVDIFRIFAPDAPYKPVELKVTYRMLQVVYMLREFRKSSKSSLPLLYHR